MNLERRKSFESVVVLATHNGEALRRDPSGILVGCPQDDRFCLEAH
jgi:hypothetical protein